MQNPSPRTYGEKIALAAGSLTALAFAPTGADAAVIYNNASLGPVGPTTPITHWDVDGKDGPDFYFEGLVLYGTGYYGRAALFNSNGLNGRGLARRNNVIVGAEFQNFPLGQILGPTMAGYRFGQTGNSHRWVASTFSGTTANINEGNGFTDNVPGYMGFRFTDAGGTDLFYGWAQITIDVTNTTYTINGWAYNDTPNGPITVGDTGAPVGGGGNSVPEPSTASLLLFGLGAGGVRAWRRRKQALNG